MTLQALRNTVGDAAFWGIVRVWARVNAFGNGETSAFIALAEQRSGKQLDALFDRWLFTGERPPPATVTAASGARATPQPKSEAASDTGRWATAWHRQLQRRLANGGP